MTSPATISPLTKSALETREAFSSGPALQAGVPNPVSAARAVMAAMLLGGSMWVVLLRIVFGQLTK